MLDTRQTGAEAAPTAGGPPRSRLLILTGLGAVLAGLPLLLGGYPLYLATDALIWAIAAVGLDLLVGYLGLTSLGHIAFVGLGGYGAGLAMVRLDWPLWAAPIAGTGLALLFALITGPLALRSSGIFFLMVTLAFGQMAYAGTEKWLALTGGGDGLKLPASALPEWGSYLVALSCLAAAVWALRRVVASPFGRVLEAVRLDEVRARALGYRSFWYKFGALLISAGLAGLAGALAAQHRAFVSPHNLFWLESAVLVIMVLLGGKRSIWGPLLGAVVYVFLQALISSRTDLWSLVVGLMLIALVLSRRDGLWSLVRRWLHGAA